MAEYYPLLDRAVSGLTDPTAEARRSIYERARTALIGQLRRMEPAVPEEDIARESAALDEAIARVEARFAGGGAPAPDPAPIALPPAPPPFAPAPARVPPPLPPAGAPPVVVPSRERPTLGIRPAPAIDRPTVPVTPPPSASRLPPRAAVPPPRGTRPVMALRPAVPAAAEGLPAAGRLAAEGRGGDGPPGDAPEPDASTPGAGFAAALDDAARADLSARADLPASADLSASADLPASEAPTRLRDAALRPPAPRPRPARRLGRPAIALLALSGVAMTGIGIAAYRLRDRPEQVVATRADPVPGVAATPGKVVDRASPAAGDADAAPDPATSGAAVPAPVPQGADGGAAAPSIAVAQRAALLVDAPEEPQRVKTYVGTVVWHLDSVSPGQGQPLASAVKADIDIPDAKLKVTMLMQKNPEPQLPASHTIEFHFLPQPGNALGNVKQINVPEMRKDDDAPTGEPLAGVPVAITENYFLVGLSRGAAEGPNIRLIGERNWFDMSLLFASGKLGKLTFERGAAGQRVFDDALKAWK